MKKWIFTYLLLLCWTTLTAQTYRKEEINIEKLIEELFAMQQDDVDFENMYEGLLQVFLNPIHLNKATQEELKSIYILNPFQINSFFEYKAAFGNFISIYELQAVPGFDLQTIYFVALQHQDYAHQSYY